MAGRGVLQAGKLAGKGLGVLKKPFKPLSDINEQKYKNWVAKKAAGEGNDKGSKKDKESSGAHNDKKADYGSNPNSAKDAIENKGSGNGNNKSPDQKKNDMVNTAINGGKKDGGKQGSENKDQGGKGGNNK